MRTEVKNQIQMLGNAVAAEVTPRRDTHRRWLRLAPSEGGVSLLEAEVPLGVDPMEYAKSEADHLIVSVEAFGSLDAALEALEGRGVDTDGFDAIWNVDSPF